MKCRYSRFKSGTQKVITGNILYCALQKSNYRPELKIFERAQVHKDLEWQKPGALW
jgi:hypothetical protein